MLLIVAVLMVTTPWGADALNRVKTTAVANVRSAIDGAADTAPAPAARQAEHERDAKGVADKEERKARRKAKRRAAQQAGSTWRVTSVVDGDTIDVAANGAYERVRVIGIDTPERGVCGYSEAGNTLRAMVQDRDVLLSPGAVDDRDKYGRLLRYVDVGGVDAGLTLVEQGLAVARYDSRDGYGRHPREAMYVAADDAMPNACDGAAPAPVAAPVPAPAPARAAVGPAGGGAWPGCNAARAAGAAPVYRGDPGYGSHLDGDNDGVGCE